MEAERADGAIFRVSNVFIIILILFYNKFTNHFVQSVRACARSRALHLLHLRIIYHRLQPKAGAAYVNGDERSVRGVGWTIEMDD